MQGRVALVTGANRGIGAEVARGLARLGATVLVGHRRAGTAAPVVGEIVRAGGRAEPLLIDMADEASIAGAAAAVAASHGVLHVLVNNAAILEDSAHSTETVPLDVFDKTMRVNVRGPLVAIQRFLPLLRKGGRARIVNLTSGLGLLGDGMSGGYPAYRISKTAINALTANLAAELEGSGILVNSVDPGWVRTEMGGESAPTGVEEGADTVIYAATLEEGGPTGKVLHERAVVDF